MLRLAVKPSATSFTFTFHLKNTIKKHLQHQMQKHDKMQNSLSKRIMKLYFKSNYSRLMFMSIANPLHRENTQILQELKNRLLGSESDILVGVNKGQYLSSRGQDLLNVEPPGI